MKIKKVGIIANIEKENIAGLLIGGASLDGAEFIKIIQVAEAF